MWRRVGLIAHLFHHRHFFPGATSLGFGGGGSFALHLFYNSLFRA